MREIPLLNISKHMKNCNTSDIQLDLTESNKYPSGGVESTKWGARALFVPVTKNDIKGFY